jgi:GrpB-like predicted nucleotidyltransferase (UPF0157 family)
VISTASARERATCACWVWVHDTGMPGPLLYRRGPASARAHHLSACCPGQYLPTRNQLLRRDYLRGHPHDAAQYGALKRRLAALLHQNGDDCTRAKTELIQELTDKARAERGLPPAPVWEE